MGSSKKSKVGLGAVAPAGAAQATKKVIVRKLDNGQVRVEVVDA